MTVGHVRAKEDSGFGDSEESAHLNLSQNVTLLFKTTPRPELLILAKALRWRTVLRDAPGFLSLLPRAVEVRPVL